jgi:DsbC/DsbD-like thiol-disulfide interchange protein
VPKSVSSFILLLALGATTMAQAPREVVVRWTASVPSDAVITAGELVEVVLTAAIEPGWKMYALTQEGAGPQALTITTAPGSTVRIEGNVVAPLPFSAFDPTFNIEARYHSETATFYVPLRVPATAAGRLVAELDATYQACTDRACLPPTTERIPVSLPMSGPRYGGYLAIIALLAVLALLAHRVFLRG